MKFLKILLFLCLFITKTYADDMISDLDDIINDSKVIVTSKNSINVELENNLNYKWKILGDIKLFKSFSITDISLKDNDSTSAIITLKDSLEANKDYSLLFAWDTESSLEFKIPDSIDWYSVANTWLDKWAKWIEYITVLDKNKIEIKCNFDLWENIELNLLEELKVTDINTDDGSNITINTEDIFLPESTYILMFIQLRDALGYDLDFWDWFYNFVTWTDFIQEKVINEETNEDLLLEDWLELNSASEEEPDLDLVEVAMSATRTPDTWFKEILLVLLALMLSFGFIYKKQKA